MKKWILGAAVLACTSLGLSAQHQKQTFRQLTTAERAEKMTDRMAEALKLTEEQKKQVGQLTLENAKRHEELQEKRKKEMETQKQYRVAQEKKIAAILTKEQKVIWEQRRDARPQGESHSGRGDHGRRRRAEFRQGR